MLTLEKYRLEIINILPFILTKILNSLRYLQKFDITQINICSNFWYITFGRKLYGLDQLLAF